MLQDDTPILCFRWTFQIIKAPKRNLHKRSFKNPRATFWFPGARLVVSKNYLGHVVNRSAFITPEEKVPRKSNLYSTNSRNCALNNFGIDSLPNFIHFLSLATTPHVLGAVVRQDFCLTASNIGSPYYHQHLKPYHRCLGCC